MAAGRLTRGEKSRRRLPAKTKAKTTGVQKQQRETRKTIQKNSQTRKTGAKCKAIQSSTFFELSAELRNSIYELVLREEDIIEVDKDLEEPSILATCSQVRHEAASIWYRDNYFHAVIHDCDAQVLNAWAVRCCTVGQRDFFDVTIALVGQLDWKNLVKWCRAIWEDDRARRMETQDPEENVENVENVDDVDEYTDSEDGCLDDQKVFVVCNAHYIAMTHKDKPWSACRRALERYRSQVERDETEWLSELDSDDGSDDC